MISEKICFEPDELVNLSIMAKMALAIVEGVDDAPIYQRICNKRDIEVDVYASEMLIANQEGCEGVKTNIREIRNKLPHFPIENYVIGIIDRDARYFRNEIPQDSAIFVLDSYSIENHYANPESVAYLVRQFTEVDFVDYELASEIHQSIIDRISFLYYLTLEAIKNACEQNYNSLAGFSSRIRELLGRGIHVKVLDRKKSLDELAERFGLSNSENHIIQITKGKWLLELYYDELEKEIKKLPIRCENGQISKCKVCHVKLEKKCYYNTTSFVSWDILMKQSFMNANLSSLNYIAERISTMRLAH
ncbi:DUF4435 domain-containing protein [Pseudomonas syringae]|uniref:DUF4435 domain-containing protein n=1 Tax=Pseudomonas syringae TaxID=317 RepID=UPI000462E901|nr:DUF4435 domain-containing protein [Pseudomonas syringae]